MTPLETILRRDEGCQIVPYQDTEGNWTIGIGHKLLDNILVTHSITEDQADQILQMDMAKAQGEVNHALPWAKTLDPIRKAILCAMAFQMGINGLLGFHRMLAAVKAHDWHTAMNEMLDSDWSDQTPERADRYADIMKTGLLTSYYE